VVLKAAPNIQFESIRRIVEDLGRRCEVTEPWRDLDMVRYVQGYLDGIGVILRRSAHGSTGRTAQINITSPEKKRLRDEKRAGRQAVAASGIVVE